MSMTMIAPNRGQEFNCSSGRTYTAGGSGNLENVHRHDLMVLREVGSAFQGSVGVDA